MSIDKVKSINLSQKLFENKNAVSNNRKNYALSSFNSSKTLSFSGGSARDIFEINQKRRKLTSDEKKLAEYGIDINEPFEITQEMVLKMKKKGAKGFWKAISDGTGNMIPFISGFKDIYDNVQLLNIVKKQEKGKKLKKDEKIALYSYLLNQAEEIHRGKTFMGKVGEMLSHLPAFAGEFVATGGIYNLGRGIAAKATKKVLGDVAKKQTGKYVLKNVTEVAVGSAFRTVALPHMAVNDYLRRRVSLEQSEALQQENRGLGELTLVESSESKGASAVKGIASSYFEVVSEQSGAMFSFKFMKPVKKFFEKVPVLKYFAKSNSKVQSFVSKTGFNGLGEEYMEERLNGFLIGITAINKKKDENYFKNLYESTVPTLEQSGVELTTTALWGGMLKSGTDVSLKAKERFGDGLNKNKINNALFSLDYDVAGEFYKVELNPQISKKRRLALKAINKKLPEMVSNSLEEKSPEVVSLCLKLVDKIAEKKWVSKEQRKELISVVLPIIDNQNIDRAQLQINWAEKKIRNNSYINVEILRTTLPFLSEKKEVANFQLKTFDKILAANPNFDTDSLWRIALEMGDSSPEIVKKQYEMADMILTKKPDFEPFFLVKMFETAGVHYDPKSVDYMQKIVGMILDKDEHYISSSLVSSLAKEIRRNSQKAEIQFKIVERIMKSVPEVDNVKLQSVCKSLEENSDLKTCENAYIAVDKVLNVVPQYLEIHSVANGMSKTPEISDIQLKTIDLLLHSSGEKIKNSHNPTDGHGLVSVIALQKHMSREKAEYQYKLVSNILQRNPLISFNVLYNSMYTSADLNPEEIKSASKIVDNLFEAKDRNGEYLFSQENICEFLSHKQNLKAGFERIAKLAAIKANDGSVLIPINKYRTLTNPAHHWALEDIIDTSQPSRQLGANDFYELVFQEEKETVSKYGCKSFKEFEEKIKTMPKEERAEAGKILGEIKKKTIGQFKFHLPAVYLALFSGETGTFTAKDFDSTIKKLNENAFLRHSLEGFEETGALKFKKEFYEKDELMMLLFSKDRVKTFLLLEIIDKFDMNINPEEFSKNYKKVERLGKLQRQKMLDNILANKKDIPNYNSLIDDVNNVDEIVHSYKRLYAVIDFAGEGKLSEIINNETPENAKECIDELISLKNDIDCKDLPIREVLAILPKYNEFKQFLSVAISLLESGEDNILKNICEESLKHNKVNFDKINTTIYKMLLSDARIDKKQMGSIKIQDEIKKWDMNYFPYMLVGANKLEPEDYFSLVDLFKTTVNNNYQEYLFNPKGRIGKLNIQTRKIFEKEGLNFDKWMNYKGERSFTIQPKISSQFSNQLVDDILQDVKTISEDEKIKSLVNAEFDKFEVRIQEDKILNLEGKPLNNEELLEFLKKMNGYINKTLGIYLKNAGKFDIRDSFFRYEKIMERMLESSAPQNMTVSLWKRNVSKDLFIGHYCQCCIALNSDNNKAIVDSLSHVVDQAVELKDSSGKTIGKAKVLFIKDEKTNQPIMLVNGFEIAGKYAKNNLIRNEMLEYLKDYSKEVVGKEIPILTGDFNYQKVNTNDYETVDLKASLLGKVYNDTYHLDSYATTEGTAWATGLYKPKNLKLKVMFDPSKN